jgi:hypothetical protein
MIEEIGRKEGQQVESEGEDALKNDPILGGVGRAEFGSLDWSDMETARLARQQEEERELDVEEDILTDDERIELNVLDELEKEHIKMEKEIAEHLLQSREAAERQELAEREYREIELRRQREYEESVQLREQFRGPTISERAQSLVATVRDWLGF